MSYTPRITVRSADESLGGDEPPSYDESRNRPLSTASPTPALASIHSPTTEETSISPINGSGPTPISGSVPEVQYDIPDIMPTLSILGAPSELFVETVPYYMMLTCFGNTARLHGSHQPSLRLIAEYFKKWSRATPARPSQGMNSQFPLIEVKIFGSRFSQRDYVDLAVLQTKVSPDEKIVQKSLDINPAMIVGFIQGVLGYRIIHIAKDEWHFTRDKPFLILT